jgi:hypothetical protein
MEVRHQIINSWLIVIVLFGVLGAFHSAFAQQASVPTLDEILLRLESNRNYYDTQIPNFFCNEHVISKIVYGQKRQVAVTDSVFRVEHVPERGQATSLSESRQVKAINGVPANGSTIAGPVMLTGVFSGGLDTVSVKQQACMRYTLQPIKPGDLEDAYVIQFATQIDHKRRQGCVLDEDGTGRVFIDPATMQVTRMELTVPHHTTISEVGIWTISVDYVPVLLGGRTFTLPKTIVSTFTSSYDDAQTISSFVAQYADYHKLEVTSRILPSTEQSAP